MRLIEMPLALAAIGASLASMTEIRSPVFDRYRRPVSLRGVNRGTGAGQVRARAREADKAAWVAETYGPRIAAENAAREARA